MYGPDKNGNFREMLIKGIQENRVPIEEAGYMQAVTVAIRETGEKSLPALKQSQIRKGTVLINPLPKVKGENVYHRLGVKYFDAAIQVRATPATIKAGYQGVLHIGGVRSTIQAVKVGEAAEESSTMCVGDEGIIRFKFKYGVEFVEKGAKILIRDTTTQMHGVISQIYGMNEPPQDFVD